MADYMDEARLRAGSQRQFLEHLVADVLELEPDRVKLDRSFLALGGDSLRAIDFMSRCMEENIEVDIADILTCETVSGLIDHALRKIPQRATNALEPSPVQVHRELETVQKRIETELGTDDCSRYGQVERIAPCSSAQDNFIAGSLTNPGLYSCRFRLDLSPLPSHDAILSMEKITLCWKQLVSRHPVLRTTFLESETSPGSFDQIVWAMPRLDTIKSASSANAGSMTIAFGRAQPERSCEIGHQVVLTETGDGGLSLEFNISHALVDGQSAEVLVRDLFSAYTDTLPSEPALAYADWVVSQTRESVDEAQRYWSEYLWRAEPSHLPVSYPGRQGQQLHGFQVIHDRVPMPPSVNDFCAIHSATVVNICQVAWALVLQQFTNSRDISFSYASSGRQNRITSSDGTSRTLLEAVGPFVNTLPCRLKFTEDTTIKDLLESASRDFVAGLPFQSVDPTAGRDDGTPQMSRARQWGNTCLSFHRKLPGAFTTSAPLSYRLVAKQSPSTVSEKGI